MQSERIPQQKRAEARITMITGSGVSLTGVGIMMMGITTAVTASFGLGIATAICGAVAATLGITGLTRAYVQSRKLRHQQDRPDSEGDPP